MAVATRTTREEWDLDPVPPDRRSLGSFDLALLWGDLSVGLLVLVAGGLLVPALSFTSALAAIVVGSALGSLLLGAVGVVGARRGVPTMVLLHPVLGERGSWVPSALNALQLIGWTAVEFWAMSRVANVISVRAFGFSARPLWLVLVAIACTALALWGPIGVVHVWMKRFGAWFLGAITAIVTILVLSRSEVRAALSAPGTGGLPFGTALDLVIALPVSWMPLVADYTRLSTTPRAAFSGTFWGYFIGNLWLYALGALLVLSGGAASPTGMAAAILALAGGSIAGVLFLAAILTGETDEAFADIYSAVLSIRNISGRLPHVAVLVAVTAVSATLAWFFDMDHYETFLFLIGSIFVPLFGVVLAESLFGGRRDGARKGARPAAIVAWTAGFVAYHWVLPTGPAWWIERVDDVVGDPLSVRLPWMSASLVAFALSFLIAAFLRPPEGGTRRPFIIRRSDTTDRGDQ